MARTWRQSAKLIRDLTGNKMNYPGATGYCCPPFEHRWQPGESGNPKGRPKGSVSFKRRMRELLLDPKNSETVARLIVGGFMDGSEECAAMVREHVFGIAP